MALTKADIINAVQGEEGLTKQQGTEIIETLIEIVKSTLETGEDVLISGFGKFCVREKKQRRGRNPATGGNMILRSRKVVSFRCSRKLRDKINKQQQVQ